MKNDNETPMPVVERILIAAEQLFYEDGIQAVGIDRITQEAGVALKTLYRHFPSKDILVEQYLRSRDVRWRARFTKYVDSQADPKENILSLFDALDDWFNESTFRGCAFINAAGELGDGKPDIFAASKEHKEYVYLDILDLCQDVAAPSPEVLAQQIALLVEGAIVRAYLNDDKAAALCAKEIAAMLI